MDRQYKNNRFLKGNAHLTIRFPSHGKISKAYE